MRALLTRLLPSVSVLALAGAAPAGVVVDDFTGDGRLDLVVSGNEGAVRLLALEEDGAVDRTGQHGLDGLRGAGDLRAVDADADGRLDLLVLPAPGSGGALRLLVRDDEDRFQDATERSGLAGVPSASAAAFTDLDLDGSLDLVVGTAGEEPPYVRVWKGAGDGTFTEVTDATGVLAGVPCVGLAVGDVGVDDLPELYLSLRDAPNALWRNTGGFVFTPAEGAAAVAQPAASGTARFLDYDNDRDWDLFVAGAEGAAPRIFDNRREDGWKDVTAELGLDALPEARRVAFGDLDNDGYEELVAETGDAVIALRNDRGRKFAPMEDDAGPRLTPGDLLVVADLDYDGDQDVLVSVDRIADGDVFGAGAYRNPGNDHLWVAVGVEGAGSNRFGVGCTVRVLAEDARGRRRDYFRRVGEAGAEGGSLRQDFGLGRAEKILRLEVYFPATKQWQSYFQPKYECTLIVKEGADAPKTVFRGVPTAGRRL